MTAIAMLPAVNISGLNNPAQDTIIENIVRMVMFLDVEPNSIVFPFDIYY